MIGNVSGDRRRSTGDEHQFAARLSLLGEPIDDGLPVGPVLSLAAGTQGYLMLQPRLALRQPEQHGKEHQGIAQENDRRTFPQRIGGQQSTVQIHTQRNVPCLGARVHEFHHSHNCRA
ncbi:hypothetical protein D9M70_506560 [compost metagenome]